MNRSVAALLIAGLGACQGESAPSRRVAIAGDEVVRRLSGFLFRAPPDADLQAMARSMDLSHADGVAALARAMLRDQRAQAGLDAFVAHWLEVDQLVGQEKDPLVHPDWGPELARDMVEEVRRFVRHVVLDGDARLSTLLTAPIAFVNQRLAGVYGFTDVRGPDLVARPHDGKERAGVFGLPGVIAWRSRPARTFPSRRGNYAGYRMACNTVFLSNLTAPPSEGKTMRDLQDDITSATPCLGCHRWMNPPGWAFERFDAIGAVRTNEVGLPVSSAGRLPADLLDTPAEVPLENLPDLARAVASSTRAPMCHAFFWLTFAVPSLAPTGVFEAASQLRVGAPLPALAEVVAAFQGSGQDIRALIAAVASSPPFLAP